MGFRINTNVAAMNSHMNSVNNNRGLDKSLAALSTGLRINTAADDASGLAIANQLKSQAQGLGQAIRNANDGINVAQTADGALEEYTNIINTVRTKSIQAASDGQNADSRQAIQRDINKLLEEAQNIAETTSFNGMNLLDGTFQDKEFHIGAYANETVGIDITNTSINNIGSHVDDELSNAVSNAALAANDVLINGTDVGTSSADSSAGANTTAHSANSAWAKAKAINSVEGTTGVHATAKTTVTGAVATGGSIDAGDLKINGIDIGAVTIAANDADDALMNAINAVSNQTNVTASHDSGKLVLTAKDGSDVVIETLNDSEDETGLGDDSSGGAATQSNYGKITLESDKTVAITGNTETAIGAAADQTLSADSALNSINVTTRAGAESAIKTTDAALKQIDTIRSQIGSTQNQLESTVRNISVTQVNVTAAESTIRDVDFAAESANLQKHNILAQSGVYAMSQANSAQQNVMRLLQ